MALRALTAAVVAALAAVPAAGARAGGELVVRPGSPVVHTRSTIEVRGPGTARRLEVELETPTGVPMRIALPRAAAGVWRTRYRFTDDGTWTLRVHVANRLVSRRIFVKQPPTPIPPFKPWQLSDHGKITLAGLESGGLILPLPWP